MEKTIYCTKNDCYKRGGKIRNVEYLIVHSPAVYPTVIRAVDGANNWYKRWNKSGVEKLAHGFIDDTGIYNFAPYTLACWHIGDSWGNANCIGYELCELDTKAEFEKVWNNAVNHYAALCKKYGLTADKVVGHCEAHDKGFASNHSDPEPYFQRFGKSMKDFRADVKSAMNGKDYNKKVKNKKTISGIIEILSNINTRSFYSFEDSAVIGAAYAGEKHQVVESAIVDSGTLMYRTANGRYVTGAKKYVKFRDEINKRITYSSHCQTYGNLPVVGNGCVSGTVGEAKRLEAVTIDGSPDLEYRVHCQTYGWMNWKKNGQMAGTVGEGKRLEAVQIKRKDGGTIKYRLHIKGVGWGPWAKNGETAGTTGEGKRAEAIQIVLE
jgi:N-acetylmuramoyl-L-alanine amidase CwlA